MPIQISHIDHLALTVKDIEVSCQFYTEVLGMRVVSFADNRKALVFGNQKINLHELGKEHEPKAKNPTSGAIDLCLISDTPLKVILNELERLNILVEVGPIIKTGATNPINSVYIRDPDNNLIEISNILCPDLQPKPPPEH